MGTIRTKAKTKPKPPAKLSAASTNSVAINRAPVLTLWVAVVVQRQGYSWQEALTIGKLVAGWFAQSKGKAFGIYEEKETSKEKQLERERHDQELGVKRLDVFGLHCPAVTVGDKQHAVSGGQIISPGSVQGGLKRAFGDRLEDAKTAMEALAGAIQPDRIGKVAYKLYELFRPEWRGWGVKGEISLSTIRGLAQTWQLHV